MLNIFNGLKPFFKDNYRRISVREYARLKRISPPTASKLLEDYKRKGVLKKEREKQYIYYSADRESRLFIELSRVYWRLKLERAGLIELLENEFLNPVAILFGSLSKAEAKKDSDIDIAVFAASKKRVNLGRIEKKLKRKIQVFVFKDRDVKNRELLNNILNGFIICGSW